jgi:hypothetical protein
MYVFGDSTLDVGNNNYLPGMNVPRANTPYYGVDFPGLSTGRFSNGLNTADFIGWFLTILYAQFFLRKIHIQNFFENVLSAAKMIGFVSSPPAYLVLAPSSGVLVSARDVNGYKTHRYH